MRTRQASGRIRLKYLVPTALTRLLVTRFLDRLSTSRWPIRLRYSLDRFAKSARILHVRLVRKALIRFLYRHTDYAPPPSMLVLRVTHACNLRCIQCGQWGDEGVFTKMKTPIPRGNLSTEEWKRLIARAARFCPHIYFFGGEPFVRKDLLELVSFASECRVAVGINTNGNFLSGKGRALVESGLDYLIVSLDGPREINNQIRLGKGDVFGAAVDGVKELVRVKREGESRYPLIEVGMTVTAENHRHVGDTADIARDLGADYFVLSLGTFTTRELAEASSEEFRAEFGSAPKFYRAFVRDVDAIDIDELGRQLARVRQMWGSRFKQYPPILGVDLEKYYRQPDELLVERQCIDPWVSMQVMPNGDMAYCEDFADLITGNVARDDPLAVWNGEMSRAWRRRIRTKGVFAAENRCCNYYLH